MSVIIRLQNLPISANASNIRRFFGGLTIPEGGVNIVGGNEGDAFIAFATDEDARKAMLLDRQSINGAPVRLFLSSKTEMQSIIESARSSAFFSGAGTMPAPQNVPQKSETMSALDVTAPTLPSSFPSYRNGATRDSFANESTNQFAYPYSKGRLPTIDITARPPDLPARNKNEEFLPDLPLEKPNIDRIPEHERPYYTSQPASQPSRFTDAAPGIHDYPPPRDAQMPDRNQAYRSYYGDYDYNRRPPSASQEDHFMQRGKDNGMRNNPREHFPDHYSRPTTNDMAQDYGKYPHTPSPRPFPDRFPNDGPRDMHRSNMPYPPDTRGAINRQPDCEPNYSNPRMQEERDFTSRPWLNEDVSFGGPKRPFPPPVPEFDDYPSRKRRVPPFNRPSGETDFVTKVTLPISEVNIKTIFEILKGVHIVPKWGIRIEEDTRQRHTGYVFIMMTAKESYDRALSYNGRKYKGETVYVVEASLDEFYNVTDSNFGAKCPPDVAKKLPTPSNSSPPYYSDGCLELTDLPVDTTKHEVVRFLGAPGLTTDDVVLINTTSNDKANSYLRALVKLRSANDIKILLSAKPRPFRPDSPSPVNLNPISKPQFTAYSKLPTVVDNNSFHQESEKQTQQNQDTVTDQPKPSGLMTCAYITGFSHLLKDSEVLRLFPSILIPGDAIRMGADGVTAHVDFISENNCRRAMSEVADENSKIRQAHPSVQITGLSRSDMESRLGITPKSDDHFNFDRPRRDRDPRDSRNQWDARPRIPQHQFNNRPPAPRQNFDDGFFSRQLPGPPFDEFRNDPGRRPRQPMENVNPPMPPRNDNMMASRPPQVPAPRRPGSDFVTVFVGNFPPTLTVDQLAAIMSDYFFIPGSIRMRRDPKGQLLGEALLDFKSSYDADRALRDLNGYQIAGRPLVLRFDHRN